MIAAFALAALAMGSSGELRADDAVEPPHLLPALALKQMTIEELLAQQVMSVSRKPENWGQAASDVFLIRGQSVPTVGAATLPELLRVAPNLFVAQVSSSNWAINARGFMRANGASNKLLVMIDGRTVYSPLFSNVFWDSIGVFLPDLAQVEVISGPAGSTWGANAVNGVINVQTASARSTLGGLLVGNAGTEGHGFGVRYGFNLGDRGAMRVYYQQSDNDSSRSMQGKDDHFDAWTSRSGGFRADWTGGGGSELTVSGDGFAGRFDNGSAPRTEADGANLMARWSRDLSPDSQLWVRVYHDYSRRDIQSLITEVTRTTDFEFQHRIDFRGDQEFLWGGNYRHISDDVSKTVGFILLPPELQFHVASVFGQHEVSFAGDTIRLTSGLRIEHNKFSGVEYQPSFRLAHVAKNQTVWLSVSRATRIPSRLETSYYAPESPPYIVAAGQAVRSETVQAHELGWRSQLTSNASLTATLFYNDYDHLRSVEPTTPISFGNLVKGESHGAEFFADWQKTKWWRIRLGGFYTEQSTKLKPGGADLENTTGESSFPKYQLQFRNTFNLRPNLTLWTALRHVAEVPIYEPPNKTVIPAYTELDATLRWEFRPGSSVVLAGRNLLDRSHPEIGTLATRREIPRSVTLEFFLKF